jgi:hypothetical protein
VEAERIESSDARRSSSAESAGAASGAAAAGAALAGFASTFIWVGSRAAARPSAWASGQLARAQLGPAEAALASSPSK